MERIIMFFMAAVLVLCYVDSTPVSNHTHITEKDANVTDAADEDGSYQHLFGLDKMNNDTIDVVDWTGEFGEDAREDLPKQEEDFLDVDNSNDDEDEN